MTHAVQTAECWNASAERYVATAEPFTGLFCADAVALAAIAPGMRLLDVATGPGALALGAARAGAVVTAIDFSATMVALLQARIGALPITAARMDGQALDLPDAHFDRACSVFGIPLFPDWQAGLNELARVTRPGGLVVVGVADNPFGFGPNRLLADARAAVFPDRPATGPVAGMIALSDRTQVAAAMQAAGLREVTIHARTHDFPLDPGFLQSGERMIDDNPMLAGLDADEGRAVVAEARIVAERLRTGGATGLPGTALIAVGTRG